MIDDGRKSNEPGTSPAPVSPCSPMGPTGPRSPWSLAVLVEPFAGRPVGRRPGISVTPPTYENLKVQVYGDAAVATGITVVKGGSYKGKDSSGKFPWTDTWVKRGGQWQCDASHSSKIVPEAVTTKVSDISGIYTLVSVSGNKLPFTASSEGGAPVIRSGAFTINNDGTCSSKVILSLPSGADSSREVSASYTREGSKLTMMWTGAGSTIGTVEGNTFTMDNEGMIFAYRK